MAQPITVDNSRPATVRDTARILGVSKKRTNQLIELVRRMIHKDARTGEFVIRTSKDTSRNGSTKASKTNSLIEEARRAGKHKTKKEAVTAALAEYVRRRKQVRILEAFGSFEFDPAYDYKAERSGGVSRVNKRKTRA